MGTQTKQKEQILKNQAESKARFLIKYVECFGNILMACGRSQICRKTFYDWKKDDANFVKKVEEADEDIKDKVEALFIVKDLKKDFRGRKFWLEKRHEQYRPKINVEGGIDFTFDEDN